MQCCSMTAQKFWMVGSAAVALLLALAFGLLWPTFSLRYLLYPELKLKNGTLNYDNWKETPIPMYLEIYLFNWTNAMDITNTSIKPKFVEMGPYVFLEKHIRTNVTWSNDESTVDFNQKRVWHFQPDLSKGSLDDEITNINPIAAACGYTSRNLDNLLKVAINIMMGMNRGPLFVTRTAGELLFDGYDDPLLRVIQANNNPLFPKPPFSRMGWFVERNGSETYDGKFRMFTGTDDLSKLGNLQLWNGKNSTELYRGHCADIGGTTGELWPPLKKGKKPDLSIFAPDVCRTLNLKYDSDYSKLGINGYKWVGRDDVFDNGNKYPNMKCYCSAVEESCPDLASGVFNASSCKWDSPAFISFPHFYLADELYTQGIVGMKPNKEHHEFYIALEPQTGIPLSINAALQINLLIRPYAGISEFRDVPTLFVPMLWFKQRAELTQELADEARTAVNLPSLGAWIAYGLLGLGLLIGISTIACFVFIWKPRQEDQEPILNNDHDNDQQNE